MRLLSLSGAKGTGGIHRPLPEIRPLVDALRGLPAEVIQGSPVATLIGQETQAVVQAAVARLPAAYRAPFLLRTLEEMGYPEIAAALGLTEETARWRVCKARRLLLREVGPYLDRPTP